jgi:hypothetical protein
MRVLSDIVKRRSFRANVAAAGQYVPRTPNDVFDCGHQSTGQCRDMFMSAKLDRLAVGSIL